MSQCCCAYGGLRVGLQSYTLRKFEFEPMLEAVNSLGMPFIEVFPGHHPADANDADMRALYEKHDVELVSRGVLSFGKDPEEDRAHFEFAKRWGIKVLSANPTIESLPGLDKLVEEYDVKIAIHNHGPKSTYPDQSVIGPALEGRHPHIGLCVDTGHFLRAHADPLAILDEFADRVHSVHLKDMDPDDNEYIVGDGPLDLTAVMNKLQGMRFQGPIAIEYEEDPENPVPALEIALERIAAACKRCC